MGKYCPTEVALKHIFAAVSCTQDACDVHAFASFTSMLREVHDFELGSYLTISYWVKKDCVLTSSRKGRQVVALVNVPVDRIPCPSPRSCPITVPALFFTASVSILLFWVEEHAHDVVASKFPLSEQSGSANAPTLMWSKATEALSEAAARRLQECIGMRVCDVGADEAMIL